mmetsp:Transcript_74725/g.139492  ORF Transcript_74725/g.139492 Transcript_74725/m.139492 type:complete len:517 (-) Transcript_74725:38-1588(-)
MTICVGSLRRPMTEDNRSVAGNLRDQIAGFREKQEFTLTVVSRGMTSTVMAVGVVGCPSCNRNPHITVATSPRTAPAASNKIPKWEMLPQEEQFTLQGMVWQRGSSRPKFPPGVGDEDDDVEYSCLALDQASIDMLLEWQKKAHPDVEKPKADHVKICSGSLTRPKGSVSSVRSKIAQLEQGQEFAMKVTSSCLFQPPRAPRTRRGVTNTSILAVGVEVACPTAARYPFVLVAGDVEEQRESVKKLNEQEWKPFRAAEQLNLRGMVWQRGGNRPDHPAAWRWKAKGPPARRGELDTAGLAKSIATQACRGYLAVTASGGLPRTKGKLEELIQRRNFLVQRLYVHHPYGLALALSDKVQEKDVLRLLERWVQPPSEDPNGLYMAGPQAIPDEDVQKVVQKLSGCTSCDSAAHQAIWITSQACSYVRVPSEVILTDLQDKNLVKIAADGSLVWSLPAVKACGASEGMLPYTRAWPLDKRPNESEAKAKAAARLKEMEERRRRNDSDSQYGSDDDDDDD